MEAPKSRERRSAQERRAQILEAAVSCIAAKGFHAATMDDLARASGLSKGSLLRRDGDLDLRGLGRP
jgi:AcrR family transcriptional regulator